MEEKIGKLEIGIIGAALIYAAAGFYGLYGTRGQTDLYNFEYKGQPSAIVQEDKRLWFDDFFIRIGDKAIIDSGHVITDDGKKISISFWDEKPSIDKKIEEMEKTKK